MLEMKLLTRKKMVSGEQRECMSFIRKTECSEYCSSRPSVEVWEFLFFPSFYSKIEGDTFPASKFIQSKVHIVVIVSNLKFPVLSMRK